MFEHKIKYDCLKLIKDNPLSMDKALLNNKPTFVRWCSKLIQDYLLDNIDPNDQTETDFINKCCDESVIEYLEDEPVSFDWSRVEIVKYVCDVYLMELNDARR